MEGNDKCISCIICGEAHCLHRSERIHYQTISYYPDLESSVEFAGWPVLFFYFLTSRNLSRQSDRDTDA